MARKEKKNSEESGLRLLNVGLSMPARIWDGQNPDRQGTDPTRVRSNTARYMFRPLACQYKNHTKEHTIIIRGTA